MAVPTFKSFVSEKEIEEVKQKRQEEWEKVRKPDQPLQRPEEPVDNRTLYEKLKNQKDQKQEEWEDQFKFKNMIYKGLDDDEAGFLQFVAVRQAERDAEDKRKELEELSDYREAVLKLQEVSPTTPSENSSSSKQAIPTKAHKSQLSVIAGSIKTKRKRSASQEEDQSEKEVSPGKKARLEAHAVDSTTTCRQEVSKSGGKSVISLPGLSAYSSSDSDNDADS